MKIIPSSILMALLLFSCEPAVTFNDSQPTGTASLNSFGQKLPGKYLNLSDSSFLIINSNYISREYNMDIRMAKNKIDSAFRLVHDTLIYELTNTRLKATITADSVFSNFHQCDTIFQLSQTNVLKKFRNRYFLNTFYGDSGWGVKQLFIEKGKLIISSIDAKSDLESLREITGTPEDTVMKFDPGKREFKKFVRKGGFRNREEYIRL
jgi:hypothetical protein